METWVCASGVRPGGGKAFSGYVCPASSLSVKAPVFRSPHTLSYTGPWSMWRPSLARAPRPLLLTVRHLPPILSDSASRLPACPFTKSQLFLLRVLPPISSIILIHTPASVLDHHTSLSSGLPAALHTVTSAIFRQLKLRRLPGA